MTSGVQTRRVLGSWRHDRRVGAAASVALSRDPLQVILFLLMLISISRVHQHFPALAPLRPALVLNAVAVFYLVLNPGQIDLRGLLRIWPAKVIVGLAVLACLSAIFGMSLGRSATYILQDYSKVLVFAFLLIAAIRHTRDLATFSWAYVVACGVMALLAFTAFGVVREGPNVAYRLQRFYSYDANDLSCVMLVGLPLSLALVQASSGLRKWIAGAVLVGIGLTLARAGSRGAFVAMLVVGVYLLFSLRAVPVVKRVGVLAVVIAAVAIGAPEGYWAQMKTIFSPTEDYNWTARTGRKQLTERGLGYMMDRPVFGLGIDNFPMAEGQISEHAREFEPGMRGVRWAAAHNSYVQAGAELGVPGLMLWSSLVWGGFWSARRVRRRLPRDWARGSPDERFLHGMSIWLPVAYIGFGISAAFVSFAYVGPVYVLSALLIGLHVSLRSKIAEAVRASGTANLVSRRIGATPLPVQSGTRARGARGQHRRL